MDSHKPTHTSYTLIDSHYNPQLSTLKHISQKHQHIFMFDVHLVSVESD